MLQSRALNRLGEIRAADDSAEKVIEATFANFTESYDMGWCTESIDPHAFDADLAADADIRVLVDHDTRLVLARTAAGTAKLWADERGLHGRFTINEDDSDATNLYARVKRGDVSQCSFCFDRIREEVDTSGDKPHYRLTQVKLYEVSVVTFPAYKNTEAVARSDRAKDTALWKERTLRRLKHGT